MSFHNIVIDNICINDNNEIVIRFNKKETTHMTIKEAKVYYTNNVLHHVLENEDTMDELIGYEDCIDTTLQMQMLSHEAITQEELLAILIKKGNDWQTWDIKITDDTEIYQGEINGKVCKKERNYITESNAIRCVITQMKPDSITISIKEKSMKYEYVATKVLLSSE